MAAERILVIDDDPGVARLCQRVLSDEFEVEIAGTGADGLALLEARHFALVLLDLYLPDGNGLDVLRSLRQSGAETAVIVVTGHGTLEAAIEALQSGAQDFVVKPFAANALLSLVHKVLERERLRQENLRLKARMPILEITKILMSETDPVRLNRLVLEAVLHELKADSVSLMLLDDARQELVVSDALGLSGQGNSTPIAVGEGAAGSAVDTRQPILVPDGTDGSSSHRGLFPSPDRGSEIAVPLMLHNRTLGALNARRAAGAIPFSQEDLDLLSILGGQVAVALENARLYQAVQQELNERRQANQALRESEERFRGVFEAGPLGMAIVDLDYRLIRANAMLCHMLGYTEQELGAFGLGDLLHPDDLAREERLSRQLLAGEIPSYKDELRLLSKDKGNLWVMGTATVVRDANDEPAYGLFMVEDITERKKAEQALRRYAERLRMLYEIGQGILAAHSPQEIARAALERIQQSIPCRRAEVILVDATMLTVDDAAKERGAGIAGQQELAADEIERLRRGEIVTLDQAGRSGAETSALTVVPLIAQDESIGFLCLQTDRPDMLTADHIDTARHVADQLAIAIQQARLYEQIQVHAKELEQRVADRTKELAALYSVTAMASKSLHLDTTLRHSLDQALAAVEADAGAVQLLDDAGALCVAVEQNIPLDADLLFSDDGLAGRVIAQNRPLVVSDLAADRRLAWTTQQGRAHTYVGVPMRARGRTLGVLSVLGAPGQAFSIEDVALLGSIADHAAVAVENDRLHEQAERAAVIQERERLARDLHDSVTQALYSLTLLTEACREWVHQGNMERAEGYAARTSEVARLALKEMRMMVYELRPMALQEEGIARVLRQRLESVEERVGIEARLAVDDGLDLAPDVEEGLYRIAQEALNNTLRHAAATSVQVHLGVQEGEIRLLVVDDGRGFDVDVADDGAGMGLANMRHRAARLGGTLVIASTASEGTRIEVRVPVQAGTES
jgi:PAS domain S-box-containing protein